MEKAGLLVNISLYEEEAELFRHMKNSSEERYGRLRTELLNLTLKHLNRPVQLASNYVLARVYKHCCIIFDLENILGNKEIENEFYHFKEEFNSRAKKEETKSSFLEYIR